MHSVSNTYKITVLRNRNTTDIPEVICIFLPNHHLFPSFIIDFDCSLLFFTICVYIFESIGFAKENRNGKLETKGNSCLREWLED